MSSIPNITASGASVTLTAKDATAAGIESAKAKMAGLLKAEKANIAALNAARKAGDKEAMASATVAGQAIRSQKQNVMRGVSSMYNPMEGEGGGPGIRGYAKGFRGLSHMVGGIGAMSGLGELPGMSHITGAAMGAAHLSHLGGAMGIGAFGMGAIAAPIGILIAGFGALHEWVGKSKDKFMEITLESDRLAKFMASFRDAAYGEQRAKMAEEKVKEARAEKEKLSAEIGAGTPDAHDRLMLDAAQFQMNKWGEIARKEREGGDLKYTLGASGYGAGGMMDRSMGYSIAGSGESHAQKIESYLSRIADGISRMTAN